MAFEQFKVLTFDVVGTLIDFEKGILDTIRFLNPGKILSDDAIFTPYVEARDLFPGRTTESMADVYRHVAAKLHLDAGISAAEAFQARTLYHPPFTDSVQALKRLRRRFRLVAMTNTDRVAFTSYAHALGNPFHDSVTADEARFPKPDPRFFCFNEGRQSALGYKREEILHVAQSQYHDIGVARELGYTVCWIQRRMGQEGFGGSPTPKEVTRPDFHFATLEQLADAIDADGSAASQGVG